MKHSLFMVLVAAAICLSVLACGDPTTQVYAANRDPRPYLLVVLANGENRNVLTLPPNEGGMADSYPADLNGTVQLLGADCSVLQTVEFAPGTNLITVEGGHMTVQAGADLSSKPVGDLDASSECP